MNTFGTPVPPQTPSPIRKRHAPTTPSRETQGRKWARHCGCAGPCQAELFGSDDSDCDNLDEDELKRLMQRRPRKTSFSSSIDDLDGRHRVATITTSPSDIVITSCPDSSSGSEESDLQASQPPMLLHYIMGF